MLELDIDGKTQEEIEQLFSKESIDEAIAIELSPLLDQMPDTYYDKISNLLGKDSTDFVYDLVVALGHPGITQTVQDKRTMEVDALFKFVLKLVGNKVDIAVGILEESDGILFDVETLTEYDNAKQDFYSFKAIVIDYVVSDDILELQKYKMFRLPLIEKPLHWYKDQSGGYHTTNDKCTLNLGEAKQPQSVLDVLNTLQDNQYELNPDISLSEKIVWTTESLMKKKGYSWETAQRIAEQVTLSAESTFYALKDKTFYFEWKYDFRGRMYCAGYNLSLQGDSYTKGSQIPVLKG